MFPKLSLALAFLLSASILAAAELRTEVPYFMVPHIWAFGGGVAPAAVGNEECPSAVRLTPGLSRGVPIIFSDPHSHGESVAIDENRKVLIRFNASIHGCQRKTWGNFFYVPMPKTVPIDLLAPVTVFTYEPIYFKVKSAGHYYRVYTQKHGDEGIAEYDLINYYDEESGIGRLAISTEVESILLFYFAEAKNYNRVIESVVESVV